MFIRVKDPSTGHEFDVPEEHWWLSAGLVKPVKKAAYPPSPVARPAKHHLDPAPSRARQSVPSDEAPSSTAEKEQTS